jgi:transcriptional regulator with XRE-family HTH domain
MITAEQIRAARALLRLDQTELARRSHVSLATLRRIEGSAEKPRASAPAVDAVRQALEKAGIEFIENGVRRRKRRTPEEKEARFRLIMEVAHRSAERAAEQPGFSESDLYDDETGLPA